MTLGSTGRRGRLAAGLVAGWLMTVPAGAIAHSDLPAGDGSQGVPGMSEQRLRGFETQVLGPEHAAEHAQERKLARESAAVPQARAVPRAAAVEATNPKATGKWDAPFALRGAIGIHALMLPTGKVMYFSYPRNPNSPANQGDANKNDNVGTTIVWDPAKGTGPGAFRSVPPPLWDNPLDGTSKKVPANIWCAGQAFLADGRVVIVGGNLAYADNPSDTKNGDYYRGLNQVYAFNPWKEKWTRQPDMGHGRWYPSEVLMPDGRVAIMGGLSDEASNVNAYNTNKAVELFDPSKEMDGVGKIVPIGDRHGGTDRTVYPNGTPPDGGLYPHLFWMLSGRALVAGPYKHDSWWMKNPTDDKLSATDAPDASRDRVWGSAVLVPKGPAGSSVVEQIGGSPDDPASHNYPPPTNTTETFDESNPGAGWKPGAPLNVARSHLNTVLLPDSSMVTVGGGLGLQPQPEGQWAVSGQERSVELFNPTTDRWTLGAAQVEGRAYHSTALLLPDARVISAGDDYNGSATTADPDGSGTGMDSDTAEIYSPPYLFGADGKAAPRPSITSWPKTPVAHGAKFHIATQTGTKAVLVAPSAVTHANDMNQRVVPLSATASGDGLEATAPASSNIALPGCYMLFTLDAAGTPSVARWVQLGTPTAGPGMCGQPGPPDPVKSSPSPSAPKSPAQAKPKAKAQDGTGPTILFKRTSGFSARRGRIYGKADDGAGVKTVQVALKARSGRRCRWFSPRRRRFVRHSCGHAFWIKARLTRSKKRAGLYVWRVRLHRRVHSGHYRMAVRAVDSKGNDTLRSGKTGFAIRVRR